MDSLIREELRSYSISELLLENPANQTIHPKKIKMEKLWNINSWQTVHMFRGRVGTKHFWELSLPNKSWIP